MSPTSLHFNFFVEERKLNLSALHPEGKRLNECRHQLLPIKQKSLYPINSGEPITRHSFIIIKILNNLNKDN